MPRLTKKQLDAARKQDVVNQLTADAVTMHGEIITWNVKAKTTHTHTDVVAALSAAGLDVSVAREFLPRNAFARACRKLADERVIDVVKDEAARVVFQFTRKHLDKSEWQYSKEFDVSLDKQTGVIECDDQKLREHAQQELDRCMIERTTSDVTQIVQRLFDKASADLFPLRDQGGVYFVPRQFSLFVDQVEMFVTKLNGSVGRFPVPAGTKSGDSSIQDVVASSLMSIVMEHEDAVKAFTLDTRRSTIEAAADKIKATRVKVEAYAHYLAERRDELLASVDAANQSLMEQINALAEQRSTAPPTAKNGSQRVMIFGHALTPVLKWMGANGWGLVKVKLVLSRLGVEGVKESTIMTGLADGRSPKFNKGAATLSADQVKELEKLAETEQPTATKAQKRKERAAAKKAAADVASDEPATPAKKSRKKKETLDDVAPVISGHEGEINDAPKANKRIKDGTPGPKSVSKLFKM